MCEKLYAKGMRAARVESMIRRALRRLCKTRALAASPEVLGYRLMPFGRCSKRRFYFRVGKARIYSGFKRKGDGLLEVECSDSQSMSALVDRLEKTGFNKDAALASRIKDVYLPILLQHETQVRKRKNRLREVEALRLDDRHRKMLRPRRRKVVYTFE